MRAQARPRATTSGVRRSVDSRFDALSRFASLMFQPETMRWRGVTAITNTPPRRAQSQPSGMQGIVLMEPVIAKAARQDRKSVV